jgi:hypothetical protein
MKKIIVAFDGLKYSTAAQDYALSVARKGDAFLVGVFLNDLYYHSYRIYDLVTEEGGGLDTKRKHLDKRDEKTRARSVECFENACKSAGIKYIVHKDKKAAIRELIKETIYADLLVIDSKESFSHHKEEKPTHFIRQLLPHIQCPVLTVSQPWQAIEQTVLLYDGSPGSMHAIKMLCYTFPFLTGLPAEVYFVSNSNKEAKMPELALMKEFMKRHFSRVTYVAEKGNPEIATLYHLGQKRASTLIVLGAYQRSAVSRWFRESMADVLMSRLKHPLFIAHSK